MTKDEAGNIFKYDAWNRLVIEYPGGNLGNGDVYSYDADNRRPGFSICSGTVTNSYYSTSWQDLEDDVYNPCGGSTTVSTYTWGFSYIDDIVERDQNVNGGAITRIYAQQDANHDVTALVNASGAVLERFIYDPYGSMKVLNASTWAIRSDGYSWVYTFQGGRYDPISGKINFRNRDLDPVTGTWMEQDPAGYGDGMSLYQAGRSNPVVNDDPGGLAVQHWPHEQLNGAFDGTYGKWLYDLHGFSGLVVTDMIGRSHRITGVTAFIDFWPNASKVCCNDIRIIQMIQLSDGDGDYTRFREMYGGTGARWMDNHGFALDVTPSGTTPFYPYASGGQAGFGPPYDAPAKINDRPSLQDSSGFDRSDTYWFFEDFAVCNRGRDGGKIYDGMSWEIGVFHYLLHREAFVNFYGPWHTAQVVEMQLALAKWDAYKGASYRFG